MRKIVIINGVFIAALIMSSCRIGNNNPGRYYMPDMTYSRAYETYAGLDSSKFTNDPAEIGGRKIFYNNLPVQGTVARGDMAEFPLTIDKGSDTANYYASRQVQNPLPALNDVDMKEAERLYLVNCGICHGEKLDGNGPLFNGGEGPYTAAPKNLIGDPVVSKMPDGQMFYSITYGKNAMGSYASQLNTKQRWMVVHYVKSKQAGTTNKPSAATDTSAMAKK